ncbi:MAG: deoxynucleoside kinase [Woeseiaceae bacterium]|nr:deoxynucleoside kinase [Woeseiaceae bacterium]
MTVQEFERESGAPRFIVVEGPIGAGKTQLAQRFAECLSGELVLEQVEQNPFLEQFYKSPKTAALQAQLFFLFQRAKIMEELRQSDMFAPVRVADFHIAKDRLFAELNLNPDELALYEKIYENLDIEVPEPDLVVYLQAPVDLLMTRIAERSHAHERRIDRSYMEKLSDAYARFYHGYDDSPLLIVNIASIDPIREEADFQALFERVSRISGGRHFYNPAASVAFA